MDRRSTKNKQAIQKAFAEELSSCGDISKVTVSAVAERAGIARRTFYLHYSEISDISREIEVACVKDLELLLKKISSFSLDDLQECVSQHRAPNGTVELLEYLYNKRALIAPILASGGDPSFSQALCNMAYEVIYPHAVQGQQKELQTLFSYYVRFAVNAQVGVVTHWLVLGCQESCEQMALLMCALMFVRPGDLYGTHIHFSVPGYAKAILRATKEANHD